MRGFRGLRGFVEGLEGLEGSGFRVLALAGQFGRSDLLVQNSPVPLDPLLTFSTL